jgi:hypothetical protein
MLENQTSEDDTIKQLLRLRDFTERTGVIHDAQAMQLKGWITALFGAKKFTIELDFEKFIVKYDIEQTVGRFSKSEEKMSNLLKYIKFLLGDKWTVAVDKWPKTTKRISQ